MHKLIVILGITLGTGLWFAGCGNQMPKKPVVKRSASAGAAGKTAEFDAFLQRADELAGDNKAEKFPALIMASQIRLMQAIASATDADGGSEVGRCVMFAAGAEPFSDGDLESGSLKLSGGGRVVYSEADDMKSSACQSYFRDNMGARFQDDFFEVHVSFFSFDF
jgi:hypothetical protein